jgi:hypothetical protein
MLVLMTLLALGSATAQDAPESPASELPASELPASERPPAEQAAEAGVQAESGGVKTLSGISILGNEEAPKSLVIVPWKSSQIGDGLGVRDSMDDRARAVDKDVFMRELHYYELRSGSGD